MFSLHRTLSLRYLGRHWVRALLIVMVIALGVATLVATRALNETMSRAALGSANPLAGIADLVVSNGEFTIGRDLAADLAKVPGVRVVSPRIFGRVQLPQLANRSVLLLGIDLIQEFQNSSQDAVNLKIDAATIANYALAQFSGLPPAVAGKELYSNLPAGSKLIVQMREKTTLFCVGPVEASGAAAALGGNILVLDLPAAARVLGLTDGHVHRLDIGLAKGEALDSVRKEIEKILDNRAKVRTPQEQDQAVQNVMTGMQTGFVLSGIAALVVGLFLVYNALAVTVAERRHEIGVLLSVGATREQIRRLFAGEAAVLGLAGSALGIPLGMYLAGSLLQPMQKVMQGGFYNAEAQQVDFNWSVLLAALAAGVLTAVAAALVPAIEASLENPAGAVRRVPRVPTWGRRLWQLASSLLLILLGATMILVRHQLPSRLGTYGGLVILLLGALLATPLLAAMAAHLLQPLVRAWLGLAWRLAADNLVRSPGRTGLVIAALAAGVALVVQTAGTIRSNRQALRQWVQDSIAADLLISSGSPIGAGGQSLPMDAALASQLEQIPGVERALPLRLLKADYDHTHVMVVALPASQSYPLEQGRLAKAEEVSLFKALADNPGGCIVSENFSALLGLKEGDAVTLASPRGAVAFKILGQVVDYTWNKGTVFINREDYLIHWADTKVDIFDVYIQQGHDLAQVKETILRKLGADHGLQIMSRDEFQDHVEDLIERLYGIAYVQQIIVMLVAALGVVIALLISVLQRRREMGILRAIGASRRQVVWSVLAEASLMGVIGTAIGLLMGIPLQWYVLKVLILEESGFLFPLYLPWTEALVIVAAAMGTATLAGLIPALHAVRQRIPEAIAYE